MQLEIKIVIDFGDSRLPNLAIIEGNVADAIERERLNGAFTNDTEDEIESVTVNMGWTSSGDDEE